MAKAGKTAPPDSLRGCYDLSRTEVLARSPFPVTVVEDCARLNALVARRLADVIIENNRGGKDSSFVLPVGPVQYDGFAELCNKENIRLDRLTIFMMDDFVAPDGSAIPTSHPLSFRAFMEQSFIKRLRPELGFSADRVVFPVPPQLESVSRRILSQGGVDVCLAGIGISGHLAFNDPPEPHEGRDIDYVRNTVARIVTLNRETLSQIVMGGTRGNWAVIPRQAGTLGMKELLASKKIFLLGMRPWHAGMVRRALFGPVTPDFPAALLQEHRKVEVYLTEPAAEPPLVNVTLETGERAS